VFLGTLAGGLLAPPLVARAQQAGKVYQIGVVLGPGPYGAALEGLRTGLKELGLEEGKQYVFHVRDAKGDRSAAGPAARSLEGESVDVIYTVGTSITLAAKQATTRVPMVFYAGNDPVVFGLVESIRKPGGRLTGTFSRSTELAPKRLELLKEMLPRLHRVVTIYRSDNPVAVAAQQVARDAARQLRIELLERPVTSLDELRAALRALKPGAADAYLQASDAMMVSYADLIVDAARTKKLPTMLTNRESVVRGGLVCYGQDYYIAGQRAARYIRSMLLGADPRDLPIEQFDNPSFVINLKTAKALGLDVPQSLRVAADEVIE